MKEEQHADELQTLWQNQPTTSFQISLADIHHDAAKLQRQIYWRNSREYIAAVILIIFFGYIFGTTHLILPRLGLSLIIAGLIYVGIQLHRKGSARTIPSDMGAYACLDFHLRELQRQYSALRNIWRWYLLPLIPGMAIYLIGMTIPAAISPGTNKLWIFLSFSGSVLFIASVFYGIFRLNQRAADNLMHQIDAIDSIHRE